MVVGGLAGAFAIPANAAEPDEGWQATSNSESLAGTPGTLDLGDELLAGAGKRLSAEERWQRMKSRPRVWSTDVEPRREGSSSELPPSPSRFDQLPISGQDGEPAWVVPSAPIQAEPSKGANLAPASAIVPADGPAFPRLAKQDPEKPKMAEKGPARKGGPRAITEINPFQTEETDSDIRAFAKERLADYGLESRGQESYAMRLFPTTPLDWEASNFYHYPLYFEDIGLERYGHCYGPVLQPLVSIGKFGVQTIGLPYQMTIDPICCPKYTLGYYNPGECAPKLCYQIPWNLKAAAVQAGVVTGLVFALP
jgi:hypothetical protein